MRIYASLSLLKAIMVDWHDKYVSSPLNRHLHSFFPVMILGELCNFAGKPLSCLWALSHRSQPMLSSRHLSWSVLHFPLQFHLTRTYKTPMGALSVVISAMLSSIFLKEKLTFFGWLGCSLCIVCIFLFPSITSHLHTDWFRHHRS